MSSLFGQLSGFEFPDVLMNKGPLPSTAGGPAGADGSIDGVINGTNALLENISPYAMGKSARTGSDRNYQQIPHRFQYIIPKLFLPRFENESHIPVSHAVDQGDIAFLLYGGTRAWWTSHEQFATRAPPCAFATVDVVNYILMCVQASGTKRWELIRNDLMPLPAFKDAFARRIAKLHSRGKSKPDAFDDFLLFHAVRMLVQEYFVPHGICAGSEHQGGQHETGTAPVQAAVNFVTTMTVDGKNIDLVNYWYDISAVAGDELLFTLEKQDTKSYAYNLTRYYKDPKVEPVQPPTGEYWQLVPSVLRGDPKDKPETRCTHLNAWRHHLSHGYWRVAQTFQTRRQNNINAFHRGQPLEVTFAPVWQSFRDCRHEDGRSQTYMQSHVTSYKSTKALRSVVSMVSMVWFYEGRQAFFISKHDDPDKYMLWANPIYCQVKIDDQVMPESVWGHPIPFQKTSLKCVHVTFFDAHSTVVSKFQPHGDYIKETAQTVRNREFPYVSETAPPMKPGYYVTHGVTQIPRDVLLPTGAGSSVYTGEFLLTLTQRPIPVGFGNSSDFVHAYCSKMTQHYLNFGGNFWALAEKEYILAHPQLEVHYDSIRPEPPASLSSSLLVPMSGGGGGAPRHAAHDAGLHGSGHALGHVVSELPAVHVLAPGTHASAAAFSAVQEAPPLLAADTDAAAAELPKKKRMKALKFFDGVADAGPGGAGA